MPKRGRPPKNKPLNTVEHHGRGLSSSHHSSHSSANEEEDKNENTDLKLFLPSVDLVPKLLENGYISKLSSMSTVEYNSDEDSTSNNDISTMTATNLDNQQSIEQDDLKLACKDVLLFKKYVRDSKNLIKKQIEKLEKFEDKFQASSDPNEQSTIKAIIQRTKYKPRVRKATSKSNMVSSNSGNFDIEFQDSHNILDAPKSSEYESASDVQTQHSITDNDDNDEKDEDDDEDDDEEEDNTLNNNTDNNSNNDIHNSNGDNNSNNNGDNIKTTTTTRTTTTINNGGKTASKGSGNKINKNIQNNKSKINESDDEDIDIVEVDDHQPPNVNKLGTNKIQRNSSINALDPDIFQDTDDQPSETESVHSNKSHSHSNINSKSTSKNRKGVSKNNKKKGEDKKRKKQEEEARHQYVGPHVFWASMESYLRPIKESDIEFITPKSEEQEAKYFEIPTLGTHYSEAWQLEDLERLQSSTTSGKNRQNLRNNRSTIEQNQDDIFGNSLPSLSFGDTFQKESDQLSISTDEIILGDLSMRLLSTLIDESMLLSVPLNQSQLKQQQQQEQQQQQQLNSGPAIRLNQQLFTSYSPNSQLTLEQRIQQELRSLNLYDDYKLPTSVNQLIPTKEKERDREDDEVCEELRILQNSLRAQLIINNELKLKVLKEIKSVMQKQESLKKRVASHAIAEKNYQKLIKRDKKKKKLKTSSTSLS